nr:MAG TPA: hypothetical protein [Caudoviricetes sp.]
MGLLAKGYFESTVFFPYGLFSYLGCSFDFHLVKSESHQNK